MTTSIPAKKHPPTDGLDRRMPLVIAAPLRPLPAQHPGWLVMPEGPLLTDLIDQCTELICAKRPDVQWRREDTVRLLLNSSAMALLREGDLDRFMAALDAPKPRPMHQQLLEALGYPGHWAPARMQLAWALRLALGALLAGMAFGAIHKVVEQWVMMP